MSKFFIGDFSVLLGLTAIQIMNEFYNVSCCKLPVTFTCILAAFIKLTRGFQEFTF